MLLSIIIPCYNTEKYIADTLESVKEADLYDMEVICIDDGSTDGSSSILKEWALKNRKNTLIVQENKGLSATRNVGIRAASGEFLYFLDSDDYILNLKEMYRLCRQMHEEHLDLLIGSGRTVFETPEIEEEYANFAGRYVIHHDYPEVLTGREALISLRSNKDWFVTTGTRIVRREFLLKHEIIFSEGYIFEDGLFTLQTLFLAERVRIVRNELYARRMRRDSIMTSASSYQSVLGYIHGLIACLRFLEPYLQKGEVSSEAWRSVEVMKSMAVRHYKKLDGNQKKLLEQAMSLEEYLYFRAFIKNEAEYSLKLDRIDNG
ncbi:MAG: glycosyltransferase [Erysipelotrichaceae bacterium]|nr:glycosyltransferase [Erysipelotrichaceae bacterium]